MRKKRVNKVLGVILAITLPLTIVGIISLAFMLTTQEFAFDWRNIYEYSASSHMGNNHSYNYNKNVQSYEESFETTKSLYIGETIENIHIIPSDKKETVVYYTGPNNVVFEEENGELSIYDDDYKNMGKNFRNKKSGELTIEIGKDVQSLAVSVPVTTLNIQNITVKNIDIDAAVGDVTISNVVVHDTLDLEGGVGTIRISDVDISNLDVKAGIGDTKIDNLLANYVNIENGIGSVLIENSTIDTLSTDNGIGNINIKNSDIKSRKNN